MKRWFRPRRGNDNDVVWEMKHLAFFLLPKSWGWCYQEYANEAAHRNRLAIQLNDKAREMEDLIVEFAKAEASLKSEQKSLKASQYNHLGIGSPIELETKKFKHMFPYVDEPNPKWKAFVTTAVWKKILKMHGADETIGEQGRNKPAKGRVIVSPSSAVDEHREFFDSDNAEQLVRYRPSEQKKEKASSSDGEKKGKNFKQLRSEYPREDGESQNEWDQRLRAIFSDQ